MLTWVPSECPVYQSTVAPEFFGMSNWGKVNTFNQVIDGPPIGRGAPIEEMVIYRSFHAVFVDGAKWEDTPFFQNAARRIARGAKLWKCDSPEALLRRLRDDIGALYRSLQSNGFMTQQQISGSLRSGDGADLGLQAFGAETYPSRILKQHEIKLGLNEVGEFLFLDGRHRFVLSRILGIENVPARIVFRHARFVRLKTALSDLAEEESGRGRFEPTHPDLTGRRLTVAGMCALSHRAERPDLPPLEFRFRPDTGAATAANVAQTRPLTH